MNKKDDVDDDYTVDVDVGYGTAGDDDYTVVAGIGTVADDDAWLV